MGRIKGNKIKGLYVCSKCGAKFDELYELGIHRREENRQERIAGHWRPQLNQVPVEKGKIFKDIIVSDYGTAKRITSTFFLPSNYHIVRVFKVLETQEGIWVFFQPLNKSSDNSITI